MSTLTGVTTPPSPDTVIADLFEEARLFIRRLSRDYFRWDPASREDWEQQTLIDFWRAIGRFDRERPVGPWLRKIAWRAAIRVAREKRLRGRVTEFETGEVLGDHLVSTEAAPEQDAMHRESHEHLAGRFEHFLCNLTQQERTGLCMEYLGLRSHVAAEAAGVVPQTLRYWLALARNKLIGHNL